MNLFRRSVRVGVQADWLEWKAECAIIRLGLDP